MPGDNKQMNLSQQCTPFRAEFVKKKIVFLLIGECSFYIQVY
jgi:hypothetical protein